MPRKHTLRQSQFPYHVVARSHNKQWFPLPIADMWQIYLDQLAFVQRSEEVRVYAFVLMHNHFHLLIRTPRSNIDRVMYWIMKNSTQKVHKRKNVINSIYGSRYKASVLSKQEYQLNAYKYVLRNPVVVNLCQQVEDYKYSSYHYSWNKTNLPIALSPLGFGDYFTEERIINRWLNLEYVDRESKSIKTGLDRPEFRYGKDNNRGGKEVAPAIFHPDNIGPSGPGTTSCQKAHQSPRSTKTKYSFFNAETTDCEPGT